MTPEQIRELPRRDRVKVIYRLWDDGKAQDRKYSYQSVGDEIGLSRNQVAADCRDCKTWYPEETESAQTPNDAANIGEPERGSVDNQVYQQNGAAPTAPNNLEWPIYVFTGLEDAPKEPQPVFVEPTLEGSFVVVGDVHVPTSDLELIKLVARIGDQWLPQGTRRLIVAGDYFNMNAMNSFRKRLPTAALETEFRYGEMVMDYWLEHFDSVFMILGNHDAWFWQNFGGDFGTARFKRMITKYPDRLQISPYSAVRVQSGDQQWYIPHQKEYRKNKLSVANELAMLEGANIIATHQHYSAVGRDHSNRFTIVDIGGLHKVQHMAYPHETPNCKPKMCQGFVLLLEGCAHLITPYPSMTDLSLYLPEVRNARHNVA